MLEALPDESLFSLCSRQHRLWGSWRSADTAKCLFGHPRRGLQHDLPSALMHLSEKVAGALGTPTDIALERTLLQFYAPFMPPADAQQAIASMASDSVAHLKFQMGLLTSRFRAHHPLKACPSCMTVDCSDHGWAYWHMEHQYPGVWSCPLHGVPLQESCIKANGVERFQWHLPSEAKLLQVPLERRNSDESLHRFSQLVINLIRNDLAAKFLQEDCLRPTLTARMRRMGWIRPGGQLSPEPAAQAFQDVLKDMQSLPELHQFTTETEFARRWIERVFRTRRSGTHPLRVLLVIHWLFRDADDFLQAAEDGGSQVDASDAEGQQPQATPGPEASSDAKRRVVLGLGLGRSARSVAQEVGIDVSTAMAWGAEAGIRPSRRPKAIHEDLRSSMVCALRRGDSKGHVAADHCVSLQAVTRLLRNEPGLRTSWQKAIEAQLRRRHRDTWGGSIKRMPGLGVKLLRQLHPASYAWLYRHDREWLSSNSPGATASPPRRATVRWDERDQELCMQVRRIASQMPAKPGGKPIKLWEVMQQLPELKAKQGALHRLPLTARALEDVTRRR
jgi:hypothetical protein